jgi:chorismate synthase
MPGNTFGKMFKVTTWGESHGKAVGAVIDGCPANVEITEEEINFELAKRKPGSSKFVTMRKEPDKAELLSGVLNGKTLGTPISIIIYNKDVKSEHYENLKGVFRPGHGDYTYWKKYGVYDWRGGGRASARETAARVAAGAVAKKILLLHGIDITTFTLEIASIRAENISFDEIEKNPFYFPDKNLIKKIEKKIGEIKKNQNTVGGIVQCIVSGIPAGLGEPVFEKIEAVLAQAILSIGAVKGIEFGAGFNVSKLTGSQNNDEISPQGFLSNNSGGMLAGISTGQEIVFRAAVKPIPSIGLPQRTVNMKNEDIEITVQGRHDISAVPRIVPVITAMARIVVADFLLQQNISSKFKVKKNYY